MSRFDSITESSVTFPSAGPGSYFSTAAHLIRVSEQVHLAMAMNSYDDGTHNYPQINAWVIDTSSGVPIISEQVTVLTGTTDEYSVLSSFTTDWDGHVVVILQDYVQATMGLVGVSGGLPVLLDSVDITVYANPPDPTPYPENVQTFEMPAHPNHVLLMYNVAPTFDTAFRPVSTVGDVLTIGDVLYTELRADSADGGGGTQTGHAEADSRLSLYSRGALTYEVTPTSMTKLQQDDDGYPVLGPYNYIFPRQSRGFYLSGTQVIWSYFLGGPDRPSGTNGSFYSIGDLDVGWSFDPDRVWVGELYDEWDGGGYGQDDLTGPVMMLEDGTPVAVYVRYSSGPDSVRLKALDTPSPDYSYQPLETYISSGPTPTDYLLDAVPIGPRLAPTAILATFSTSYADEFTATLFTFVTATARWTLGAPAWGSA